MSPSLVGERPKAAAIDSRTPQWAPPALLLTGLALLVGFILREVLDPGSVRLPGRDSGNLFAWEFYNRLVLRSGHLPFWNPYHFAGTPHLADPQTTVLYPPAMFLRVLPLIPFFGWMAALHLWIAGAGTLVLCRVIGLRWLTAGAAAVAVALGGSVGAWLYNGHLLLIYCTAWLPMALGLAVLSVRRARTLPHPALVLVLVLQFLAGYLQGSLYLVAAVCLYFVYSAVWPDSEAAGTPRTRPLAQLAVVAVLAIGISAFQLMPTVRLVAEAGRSGGVPYAEAASGGWDILDLTTVLFPFQRVNELPPHRDIGDRVTYVGWLLACLVPFAFHDRSRRRIAVFFAVVSIAALAMAMSDALPFYRLHHAALSGLRVPGRVLFLATVSLAVLGAIGLERFIALAQMRAWSSIARVAAVTVAAIVAATGASSGTSGAPPVHLWPWLPILAGGGLLIVGVLASSDFVRVALLVALITVSIDLTAFTAGAIETFPIESTDVLRKWMGPPDAGRALSVCNHVLGAGGILMNGQPALDGLAGVHLADYADWAYVAKTGDRPPKDGMFHRIGSEGLLPARQDLVDQANVSTIFACAPLDVPSLTRVSDTPPIYTYRNLSARPRAFWTCDGPQLSREAVIRRLLEDRYDESGRLVRRHFVNVRWTPGTLAGERRAVEQRRQLVEGAEQEDGTWRYVSADPSPANGLALIREPAVEDTQGIDRDTGAAIRPPVDPSEGAALNGEVLIGAADCAYEGVVKVLSRDQPDGHVSARVDAPVDGLVFLSEPYYSERRAFVDGRQVKPVKANLAFTAVRVPAGMHRVELRYVPWSFYLGVTVSALTALAWIALAFKQ